MTGTTLAPTDDLQKRCAEIIGWHRTGVLVGDTLRSHAESKWPGDIHNLQMAERATENEALCFIAKWGAPAPASDALEKAVRKLHAAKGRYHNQIAACDLFNLLGLPNVRPGQEAATPAQEARVPLSDEDVILAFAKHYPNDATLLEIARYNSAMHLEAMGARHHFAAFKLGVRAAEAAHGIGITAAQKETPND